MPADKVRHSSTAVAFGLGNPAPPSGEALFPAGSAEDVDGSKLAERDLVRKRMNSPIRLDNQVLSVEAVESLDDLHALEAEWLALEPSLPGTPFLTFDWAVTWWEHLAENRLLVKDKLFVRAFRDRTGELVGVAPLMLTQRPGFSLGAMRQLQLFGADPNLTEIRSLVAPESREQAVYAALMRHLRSCPQRWDWLLLTGIPNDDVVSALIDSPAARVEWRRVVPSYTLALPSTFEQFKSTRSRNIKESLRKCYNSLKRDGLDFEVRVLTQKAEVDGALSHFFRLHQARAERTDTIAHRDAFSHVRSRNFLRAVARRFADRGRLYIFQLRIQDKVAATRVAFGCGDTLYLYYSGYDPDFSKYSVMTTLVAEAIKFAIEHGFRYVNLSTGNDVSKQRWSPTETLHRDALMISPCVRGGVVHDVSRYAMDRLSQARGRLRMVDCLMRRT